ncbi:hypothetical protein MKX01_010697 [Papaver californicum]|nr:hypothetical protein MKX01_010697 [Papaver californicum]
MKSSGGGENESLLRDVEFRLDDVCCSTESIEEFLEHQERISLRLWVRLIGWESKTIWLLSWASITVSIFNYMLSVVNLMLIGHIGFIELAGASLTNLGIQGFAYGVMTKQYADKPTERKKFSSLGIICQKTIILHLGAAILLSFFYWYAGDIFRSLGQSTEIAKQGEISARGLLPQLYAFALYCPMQRFSLHFHWFLLHILFNWLAVYVLDFGVFGAAIAMGLSCPSCNQTWTGFSIHAFRGLWTYFKLTAASAVMLCLNYLNWDLQFMLGFCTTASIRVGNELGAAHPRIARFSVIVMNLTSILISIILCFTSNEEVIKAVSNLTPLLAISVLLNGIQPILSDMLILIQGIWWGMIIGVLLQTITLIILTARTDWNKEVDKAFERLRKSSTAEESWVASGTATLSKEKLSLFFMSG